MRTVKYIFLNVIILIAAHSAQAAQLGFIDMNINAVYDENINHSNGVAHNSIFETCGHAACGDNDETLKGNAVVKRFTSSDYQSTYDFRVINIDSKTPSTVTFTHNGTGEKHTAKFTVGGAYANLKIQSPVDARGKGHKYVLGQGPAVATDSKNGDWGLTWEGYNVFAAVGSGSNVSAEVKFINLVQLRYLYKSIGLVYSLILDNPDDWTPGDYNAVLSGRNITQLVQWESTFGLLQNVYFSLKVNTKLNITADKQSFKFDNLSSQTPTASEKVVFTRNSRHQKISLQLKCATDNSLPGACVLKNTQQSDLILPVYVKFQKTAGDTLSSLVPNGKAIDVHFPSGLNSSLSSRIEARYEASNGKFPRPGDYHGTLDYVFNASV